MRDDDYQALAEFRYQIRRFLHFSEEAARRAGLEPAQHQLLLAVKGHAGEPTVSEMAERLQLKHHSVVGLIDRLEESGLLERGRTAEGDRRQVHLRLTPKGEAVLRRLSIEHREELGNAGKSLAQSLRAILNGASTATRGTRRKNGK